MFLDEAVHIQWAERLYDEGRIGRPISGGRLLAVATYGLALPFDDRLVATRGIAAVVGAVTLALTALLSSRLFGPRAGWLAGLLYLLSPFALVYDRLALSDGFLAACLTGLLLATLRLIEDPNRPAARVSVTILVLLSILSKVSAILFFLPLPLALALLPSGGRRAAARALVLSLVAGLLCASPVLLFFIANGGEISAQHLADLSLENSALFTTLTDMRGWLLAYFRPLPILIALGALLVLRDARGLLLGSSVAVPFLMFALLSRPWSARYVLPVLPPFLILMAGGLDALVRRFGDRSRAVLGTSLTLLVSFSGLPFLGQLLTDPSEAPLPPDDRHQLVSGWPSGYGVRELSLRLKQEATSGPVTVFLDTGGTRTVATSLEVLLGRNPSIRLVEGDLSDTQVRSSLTQAALRGRAFAVLGPRSAGLDLPSVMVGSRVERIEVYTRPGGEWAASLFRVLPPPPG